MFIEDEVTEVSALDVLHIALTTYGFVHAIM